MKCDTDLNIKLNILVDGIPYILNKNTWNNVAYLIVESISKDNDGKRKDFEDEVYDNEV